MKKDKLDRALENVTRRDLARLAEQVAELRRAKPQIRPAYYAQKFSLLIDQIITHLEASIEANPGIFSEADRAFLSEELTQFYYRLTDFLNGDSDAYLRTFAARPSPGVDAPTKFGTKNDGVLQRRRLMALAAAEVLAEQGGTKGDMFTIAAEVLGDVKPRALKAWYHHRIPRVGRPDEPPKRPGLLKRYRKQYLPHSRPNDARALLNSIRVGDPPPRPFE